MAGGLMQLVAYGAQDIYLTGNPQITFFKLVYRRHTNFSMESIEQIFNGTVDFGKRVTCTISRNGDLIYRIYFQVTLPEVECPSDTSSCFRWCNYIGLVLIKEVEVEIGGQRIDRHYGEWLNIWNELTQQPGHYVTYDNMVGNTIALTGTGLTSTEATTLYVPLEFWFCRNPGLALPLIALQYHEVRINLTIRQKSECYVSTQTVGNCGINVNSGTDVFCVPSLEYGSLWVDYIYLDTDERRRMAQASHEYLIEQLQFTGDEAVTATNVKITMNFNHPCKELIWVVQNEKLTQDHCYQWFNYTDDYDVDLSWGDSTPNNQQLLDTNVEAGWTANSFPLVYVNNATTNQYTTPVVGAMFNPNTGVNFPAGFGPGPQTTPVNFNSITTAGDGADHAGLAPRHAGRNPVIRAKIQLNGHDRFQERLGSYFNLVQPYQHHTSGPATGINVYSFALKPEEHQPSGTCNFSRIDNAVLQLQLTPKSVAGDGGKVRIYATNYNVLRIMSGMGGLAYSN